MTVLVQNLKTIRRKLSHTETTIAGAPDRFSYLRSLWNRETWCSCECPNQNSNAWEHFIRPTTHYNPYARKFGNAQPRNNV